MVSTSVGPLTFAGAPQTKQGFVFQELQGRIAAGRLRPGDWIRADEWARALGVSQTPVREALRQLEAQGLVLIHPHIGARVREYSVDEFDDYFRLRAAIESLVAQVAVERADDDELKLFAEELTELNEQMVAVQVEEATVDRFMEFNHAFHRRIYQQAKSPILLEMVEAIRMRGQPLDAAFYTSVSDRDIREIIADHRAIIKAVKTGDPSQAADAVRKHCATGQRLRMRVAGEDGGHPSRRPSLVKGQV